MPCTHIIPNTYMDPVLILLAKRTISLLCAATVPTALGKQEVQQKEPSFASSLTRDKRDMADISGQLVPEKIAGSS
jgi:hypothetical protein